MFEMSCVKTKVNIVSSWIYKEDLEIEIDKYSNTPK